MTEPSLSDQERSLLAEALSKQRSLDDPELRALLLRAPTLQRELEQLKQLSSLLDAGGHARRAEFAEATAEAPAADEIARYEGMLACHSDPRPRPRRRRRLAPVLVAAALVAMAATAWTLLSPSPPDSDPRLGPKAPNASYAEHAPTGPVDRYGTFSARVPGTGSTTYRFMVWEDNPERMQVATSPALTEPRWQPDSVQAARIEDCAAIEWQLFVKHPGEVERSVITARAARR
jgi:hypothetical protein